MYKALSSLFCAIVLCSTTISNAALLGLSWTDPALDHFNGTIDLLSMELVFDTSNGDYQLVAIFNPAQPYSNPNSDFHIVNLNMYNTTDPNWVSAADPLGLLVSLHNFPTQTAPTNQLIFNGNHTGFMTWEVGDLIANNSSIATPGSTYGSGVQHGGQGLDGLEPTLTAIVPEPATASLTLLAIGAMALTRRRCREHN